MNTRARHFAFAIAVGALGWALLIALALFLKGN